MDSDVATYHKKKKKTFGKQYTSYLDRLENFYCAPNTLTLGHRFKLYIFTSARFNPILNDEIDLELVYTKTSNLSVKIKVSLSIQYYVIRSDQVLISLRRECSGSYKADSDSKD